MLERLVGVPIYFAAVGLLICSLAQAQPNILLIIGDDQHWSDYGFMGHPVIETPNLDRLATEGLLFRNGYVPTSLCRPSLASIVTGLYPHQHRITGNDPDRRGLGDLEYRRANEALIRRMEVLSALPRLLAEAGYRSFQSGKWWEGNYRRGGFTSGMTHGDPDRGGRHGDEGLKIGREGLAPIFQFIEVEKGPFFVWYAPFLPHTPHNPPDQLLSKYRADDRPTELSSYYAMCEWFDETVGGLLEYLDERKFTRNTLVVFLADNGWIQNTGQDPLPSGWRFQFRPRSKRSANEGGIRTPIILRLPGTVGPAQSDTPVSSIDLAPTILAAAGLKPAPGMSGIDLLDAGAVVSREAIFGDVYTHDVLDHENPESSLKFRWCIQGQWKLIVPHRPNILDSELRLYDLSADPEETRNLASVRPDLVRGLYGRIQSWWRVE
jgi:uncharacterized sulfatase